MLGDRAEGDDGRGISVLEGFEHRERQNKHKERRNGLRI